MIPILDQALADSRSGTLPATEAERVGEARCDVLEEMEREPLPLQTAADSDRPLDAEPALREAGLSKAARSDSVSASSVGP